MSLLDKLCPPLPDVKCPHCGITDKEVEFFRMSGIDRICMYKLLPKSACKGFLGGFRQGPNRQLYACHKCGKAFIIP